jgi:hypothetical protein
MGSRRRKIGSRGIRLDRIPIFKMSDSRLKQILERYPKIFTDSELIVAAFNTSMDFINWDNWFQQLQKELSADDMQKLFAASVSALKRLPSEVDSFGTGAITPERSAAETISESIWVHKEFLLFLNSKREGFHPN